VHYIGETHITHTAHCTLITSELARQPAADIHGIKYRTSHSQSIKYE